MSARLAIVACVCGLALVGCGHQTRGANSSLDELRKIGPSTSDPGVAERWFSAELVSPGGDPVRASKAREVLDKLKVGSARAHLLRGLDDVHHGRMTSASEHYLASLQAARNENAPESPLIAWYAANEGLGFRHLAGKDLWADHKQAVTTAIDKPGFIGWRARAELVDWLTDEAWASADSNVEDLTRKQFGCIRDVRMAGPFGRRAASDTIRHYPAENPGPWPMSWDPVPGTSVKPRQLKVESRGCTIAVDEPVYSGIFYAETFLDLPAAKNLVLVAQGAVALWVDDKKVLTRDPREWGGWPRFGAAVRLDAGRHRVLARLTEGYTSFRVLESDGRPAEVKASTDAAAPYAIVPPQELGDPNALMPLVQAARTGKAAADGDDLLRLIAAELAHVEGQDDVASVLIQPLVKRPTKATGVALATAAVFAADDPVYDESKGDDLVRSLQEAATKRDQKLWAPRMALILREASTKGLPEAIKPLRALAAEFPEVPGILSTLATLYGQLGWAPERLETIQELGKRFPRDPETLEVVAAAYDDRGEFEKSDELVKRILELSPDNEIRLDRALARQDYAAALVELKRLGKRRPDRKDIAERIEDVLVRAGNTSETWKKLEAAIKKEPKSGRARLELADAQFATGKHGALRKALIEAIEAGANYSDIADAIDLIEGVTELEPYRVDALKVIKDYEASGEEMDGTAARILDYSAVAVRGDSSSRMLSHEVVRIQSPEAIGQFAEQSPPEGMVLHMRVIKKDGSILEPEFVSGKPTVTMPHLEVGDYIETENIVSRYGDGQSGRAYYGPRWFFREENIAYWRSQFVLISPSDKELVIETRGKVPPPTIEKDTGREVRTWLVTKSPAAPVEPLSAPASEFLPSVHVGWGVSLDDRLRNLNDSAIDLTPMDPRIQAIAANIVGSTRATNDQVKKLYHWVTANIEEGDESDGRRVIVGKQGNRWKAFILLCQARGIPAKYVVAKSRITTPSIGPLSKASDYTTAVLRVQPPKQADLWLTLDSKYTPFGYIPDSVRGMPGYELGGEAPVKVELPKQGVLDLIEHVGTVKLAKNGSATLELTQRYYGKYAVGLRAGLAQVPEAQLKDIIESKLLGKELRGARLIKFELKHLDDVDFPLEMVMTAEMSVFAQLSAGALVIDPPFSPRVAQLAALPVRQTPLFFGDATHIKSELSIELPAGMHVDGQLPKFSGSFAQHEGRVSDTVEGSTLKLSRDLYLASGRVQPADYAKFQTFVRQLDNALNSSIRIR
ncbi:MAG: hypothetical protein R3B07_00825 [Polyangiaceae bacterium]